MQGVERAKGKAEQQGAVALAITMMLMIPIMLLTVVSFNHAILERKSANNTLAAGQAFYAAQAGLSFGMQYLTSNTSTVTGSPSGGYINYGPSDANVTNVVLPNGAKFSTVYTNPTQNNYNLIQITSTGASPDGSSTRVVRQLVAGNGTGLSPPLTYAATVSQNSTTAVTVSANVGSGVGVATISIPGANGLRFDASPAPAGGAFRGPGISIPSQTNDPSLQPISTSTLQNNLGMSYSAFQAIATTLNGQTLSTTNLNKLKAGGVYLINAGFSNMSAGTYGTASNPLFLVVNGNMSVSPGNATITVNGILVLTGALLINGFGSGTVVANFTVNGALLCQKLTVTSTNLNSTDNFTTSLTVNYDAAIINTTAGSASFVPVPGSWSDF